MDSIKITQTLTDNQLSSEAVQYRACAKNWGHFMAAYIARCAGYRLEETLRLLGLERNMTKSRRV